MAARWLRHTTGHLCTIPPVEAAPAAAPPSGVVDLEHFEAHGWVIVPQAVGAAAVARLRAGLTVLIQDDRLWRKDDPY